MANTQAIPSSFKLALLNAEHAFGTTVTRGVTTKDTYKAALFLASATINASTTAYTTTGEVTNVSGSGYTAGGVTVTNANAPALDGTTAHWTPSAAFSWTAMTTGSFDCCQIYNSTQSNKTCLVFVFGATTITAGDFNLNMPTNNGTTGLLRIA